MRKKVGQEVQTKMNKLSRYDIYSRMLIQNAKTIVKFIFCN